MMAKEKGKLGAIISAVVGKGLGKRGAKAVQKKGKPKPVEKPKSGMEKAPTKENYKDREEIRKIDASRKRITKRDKGINPRDDDYTLQRSQIREEMAKKKARQKTINQKTKGRRKLKGDN